MSQDAVATIIERVKGDEDLRGKLRAVKDADGVVALAAACGLELTSEEAASIVQAAGGEISDTDLEKIAGGLGERIEARQGGTEEDPFDGADEAVDAFFAAAGDLPGPSDFPDGQMPGTDASSDSYTDYDEDQQAGGS